MEILNHPYLLLIAVALSLVSSLYLWRGYRERDVPALLMGIGLAIPTFDMMSMETWIAGIVVCLFAWWMKSKMESL